MKFMRNGLNKTLAMLAISMALVLPTTVAFAQDSQPAAVSSPAAVAPAPVAKAPAAVAPAPVDPKTLQTAPSGDDLKALFNSIGGLKGAGAMGIVILLIQGLMLFFRSKLADFAGKWRLSIVYGLSMVLGILALHVAGVDWLTALLHSNTIAAAQVFGHQAYDQFLGDSAKADVAAANAAAPAAGDPPKA